MLIDTVYQTEDSFSFDINIKETIYGGIDLNDSSFGLNYQLWDISYVNNQVIVTSRLNNKQYIIYEIENATDISVVFDQNMNPWCLYFKDETYYLYWYDVTINSYTSTVFPDIITPFVFVDLTDHSFSSQSDVNLFFIKDNSLYCTQQSTRFTVNNLLFEFPPESVDSSIIACGYLNNRLGIKTSYSTYEEMDL